MEKTKIILGQLASSLNRRDEQPNQDLARQIVQENDEEAIRILVENLSHPNKNIQNDGIKVLYEVGECKPQLIAAYSKEFLALLTSKNNRLQWGAMTALKTITLEDPETLFAALPEIIRAVDKGSVITRDNAICILISLCSIQSYASKAFSLLNELLLCSPVNQLPMYAEQVVPILDEDKRPIFIHTLTIRLKDIEKDTKRKRVEKVIRRLAH